MRISSSKKIFQKLVLEGSWASFGRGLGRSWASYGRSWPPLGRFLDVQRRAFFKQAHKMGSKRPSGSIWDGFGEGCERIWGGFGKVWGGIREDFGPSQRRVGRSWKCLVSFGPAGVDSQLGPPRWSAKRHNARGSSPQREGQGPRELFPQHPSLNDQPAGVRVGRRFF